MNMHEAYIATSTLMRKEMTRILRIWPQTLIPPIITTILYFVIFGKLVGAHIGMIDHVNYLTYIIPGLVMMPMINNSYANTASSFYSVKFQRSIEEMLVTPMSNTMIAIGFVAGGAMRGILVASIVFMVALCFSPIHIHHVLLTCYVAVTTAILFSIFGLINGILANKFDDVGIVPTFILTPMTYLGGVFYSVEQLPLWGKWLSHINPLYYVISGFRYALLDIDSTNPVIIILTIGLLLGLFWTLALWMLKNSTQLRQ